MIRHPPRSTQSRSSAASDVYKRQDYHRVGVVKIIGVRAVNYLELPQVELGGNLLANAGNPVPVQYLNPRPPTGGSPVICFNVLLYERRESTGIDGIDHGLLIAEPLHQHGPLLKLAIL